MRRILVLFVCMLVISSISFVAADGDHEEEIEEGRLIVEAKTSCDELTDEQLEAVGEYYMEQMHPGALHDAMHEMMGLEEDTEEHEQFHITLAQRMYCGEGTYGMMGYNNGMGYGMMGMMYGFGAWDSSWSFWNFVYIVMVAFIFAIVFWAVYLLVKRGKK